MITDLVRKKYSIKRRKIVNVIFQPDQDGFIIGHVPENTDVQFEFLFCAEFNREQTDQQQVNKS